LGPRHSNDRALWFPALWQYQPDGLLQRAVHDVRVALPSAQILGVGGISTGADAVEMMMAGANAVQVGTASFADPSATWRIAREAAIIAQKRGATSWGDITSLMHR
jgi:dihydroorotate dehydrogenase (NAD+) catalytic subunit